ncbi:hypothetical protein B0F90DRAFT_1813583 [Multifurca ochricompacta]|uniref:Uncharacterized protein n=1 Tax=Multifurca ochricompacta TaxID=376703 RepID=A0AAD4MEI5_9AGAM|nr:hypothetical protein B0F90DRAFT_1813583 [Multifurca ochricompacta]
MVSDLWQASSDGDLNKVNELLAQASPLDIEEKDQDGVTPLIAAVKNGHRDVVKALLDHGANPAHTSTHGLPEQYTSDATIVELLRAAALPKVNPDIPPQDPRFIHDPNVGPPKAYYLPHPGPYAYYPGIPVPPLPEGAIPYYHPPPAPAPPAASPPSTDDQATPSAGSNFSNLPPPEIARLIPCRYFPAWSLLSGPDAPPAQYPSPYDQPPYPPNFYPIPAPHHQFQPQPPNGVPPPHHLSPVSPQSATQPIPPPPPQFVHQRNNSEIVPPVQIPFNSSGAPVPAPGPYGPMSPVSPSYPHHGQLPVPCRFLLRPPRMPLPQGRSHLPRLTRSQSLRLSHTHAIPQYLYLNKMEYKSRSPRRASLHVVIVARVEAQVSADHRLVAVESPRACSSPPVAAETVGRGARFRSPPQSALNGNGQANLEEKLANLSITENGNHAPRQGSSGSTTPSERGLRGLNGVHTRPSKSVPQKQRVPNADEFPVLGGSSTPPQVNGHAAHMGPTAAQVLQAPAVRKDSSKSEAAVIEGQEQLRPAAGQATKAASQDVTAPAPAPVSALPHKLPVSFAAVANGAPDTSKEVPAPAFLFPLAPPVPLVFPPMELSDLFDR